VVNGSGSNGFVQSSSGTFPTPTVTGGATSGFPTPPDSSSAPVTSSAPSLSPLPTPTENPPTSNGAPITLACGAPVVTATDAPFCFTLPTGFSDTSSTASVAGDDTYKTAVEPKGQSTGRDIIAVTAAAIPVDSDQLSNAQLLSAVRNDGVKVGASGVTAMSAVVAVPVAGHRGYSTQLTFQDGVKKRFILAFDGHSRVSISCQWEAHKTQIDTGCTRVLASLQIVPGK
jgi:hypothetical protein